MAKGVYQLECRRDRVTYVRVANHDMTKFLGARVSWQCHVREKVSTLYMILRI